MYIIDITCLTDDELDIICSDDRALIKSTRDALFLDATRAGRGASAAILWAKVDAFDAVLAR